MATMRREKPYTPHWSWWLRSGERIEVGLDIRRLLAGHTSRDAGCVQQGLKLCLGYLDHGEGLVDAMKHSGMVLPVEAWCLLQAGERTGRLGETMREVGEFLKQAESRRRDLISQLWYPAFVVATGLIVMAIILLWVVPRMREISLSMGQHGRIPWLTENIGMLYGCLFTGFLTLILVIAVTTRLLRFMASRSLNWAQLQESVAGRIPLCGCLRRHAREARILRQLGTLMQGGITFPDALQMAAASSPDRFENFQLNEFRKRQLMGISFEEGLDAFKLFDPVNHPLLVTGQETGRLDSIAIRIAADVDREVSLQIKQLTRIIEPLAVITLAGLVAGLILAYILPTISMLEQLA